MGASFARIGYGKSFEAALKSAEENLKKRGYTITSRATKSADTLLFLESSTHKGWYKCIKEQSHNDVVLSLDYISADIS